MTMVSLLEFVDVNNGSINKKETGMGDTGLMHMNIISHHSPIIIINNKRDHITFNFLLLHVNVVYIIIL